MDDVPQLSWEMNWAAGSWRAMPPHKAAEVLHQMFGKRAGEEALLRAYLAARYGETHTAHFWTNVYPFLKPNLRRKAEED